MGDATRKKVKLEQEAVTSNGDAGTSAKQGIPAGASANSMSSLGHKVLLDRLYGAIYGNCIGDAIGLLTEFMNKTKAISVYGRQRPHLEYHMKHKDRHRGKFDTGGDADTNGAVAGALLGCKLGASALPDTWLNGLKYKNWLDGHIRSFLALLGLRK